MKTQSLDGAKWKYYKNIDSLPVHGLFSPADARIPAGFVMKKGSTPKLTYIAKMLLGRNDFPDKRFKKLKPAKEYVETNLFIWKLKGN